MRFVVVVLCVALVSCLSQEPVGDEPFIALDRDFAGYDTWESAYLGDVDLPAPHIAGPAWGYINHRPPAGATQFPVGTIIVKVTKPSDDPYGWQLFAMAKRGAEFNPDGAKGWEWFELAYTEGGPIVAWRGASPPPGLGYTSIIPDGGLIDGGCNTCHSLIPERDYVVDDPFMLR